MTAPTRGKAELSALRDRQTSAPRVECTFYRTSTFYYHFPDWPAARSRAHNIACKRSKYEDTSERRTDDR
eukprot:2398176-Prymnesium_polylepis.1